VYHDPISKSWGIYKVGIGGNNFIKSTDVGSREATLKMFAKWLTSFQLIKPSSVIKHTLDTR
jgi:hypothetical protein